MRPYRIKIGFSSGDTLKFNCTNFKSKFNGREYSWNNAKPKILDLDLDSTSYVVSRRRITWYFWKMMRRNP